MIAEMMSCLRDILVRVFCVGEGETSMSELRKSVFKTWQKETEGKPKMAQKIPIFFDPIGILWTNF